MISIEWGTRIISIPQSFLSLVGGTNYNLDTDLFRISLKDLEDSEEGVVHPQTHNHNTTVGLGGIDYARIIELINGYTITFEETGTPYAVNLIGSNNNILDVVNLGTVAIRSNNSAGLVQTKEIQRSAFSEGVAIDEIHGVASSSYPAGTKSQPVNNLTDALIIAEYYGFKHIYCIGQVTINTGNFADGYTFEGKNYITSSVVVNDIANVNNCEFLNVGVSGIMDNLNHVKSCMVHDIVSYDGMFYDCGFAGTVVLGGVSQTTLINCYSMIAGALTPTFDMSGDGSAFAVRGYMGGIKVTNKTGMDGVSIDLTSGQVIIDSTVVSGDIYVRGNGRLTDNSTGTTYVDAEGLQSGTRTIKTVGYVTVTSGGKSGTNYPIGTEGHPVNNMTDAIFIANREGIYNIHIQDNVTTSTGDDLTDFEIHGANIASSKISLAAGTITTKTKFLDIYLSGAFLGVDNELERCIINNVTNFTGIINDCFLRNYISMAGNIAMKNCTVSYDAINHEAIFDFQGEVYGLNCANWAEGKVTIKNMVTGGYAHIAGTGGKMYVDSSVTGGDATHAGSIWGINNGTPDNFTAVTNAQAVQDILVDDFDGITATVDVDAIALAVETQLADEFNSLPTAAETATATDAIIAPKIPSTAAISQAIWQAEGHTGLVPNSFGELLHNTSYGTYKVHVDTELLINGDGSQAYPFNNIIDAKEFAETNGYRMLVIYADVIVSGNMKNFIFDGVGAPTIEIAAGTILTRSEFRHLQLDAPDYVGNITVQESVLLNGTSLNGFFEKCGLAGDLVCASNSNVLVAGCFSLIAGLNRPSISMNSGSVANVSLRNYSGGMTITDCDHVDDVITVEVSQGSLTFDNTNVAGTMVARGIGKFVNETAGASVVNEMINIDNVAGGIWNYGITTPDVGSYGEAVNDIPSASDNALAVDTQLADNFANIPDAAENAAANWDEPIANHKVAGTFGEWVQKKLLSLKMFIGLYKD